MATTSEIVQALHTAALSVADGAQSFRQGDDQATMPDLSKMLEQIIHLSDPDVANRVNGLLSGGGTACQPIFRSLV